MQNTEYSKENMPERAVLCALITRERDENTVEASLCELEGLVKTAGGVCEAKLTQKAQSPDPATYFGKGKLTELEGFCLNHQATLAVFDDELSPSQIKNIEDALIDVRVIDRTMLILDIFAAHATSGEGKMQVELAQLRYTIPRLVGKGNELSRLGGGIGTRGPGESKLETDRRHIQRRMYALKQSIAEMKKNRETQHNRRKKSGILNVAIAGYTNAGKSTLLNYLTGADILAEDKLFATLDPTTRKYKLPCGIDILLTDTVGFISRLPHHLIDAFRSTLEEVAHADVVIVLIDASDPECENQLEVTHKLLWDLGASHKPVIYAFNKCDRETPNVSRVQRENTVYISAKTGEGINSLICALEDAATQRDTLETFFFPLEEGGGFARLYANAVIGNFIYFDDGIQCQGIVGPRVKGMFKKYIITGHERQAPDEGK